MIRRATVVVAAGGVLAEVSSGPPLTVRQVVASQPDECALCLVGSAAGPLSGDDVQLCLTLRDDARARLTATGASLAQGRNGQPPSRIGSQVRLGERAWLHAETAPVIAASGSSVVVEVELELAAGAHIVWQELLVLGRSAEPAGLATVSWSVRRAQRPVLSQRIALTPQTTRWPGMLGGNRVIATCLVSGPDVAARTLIASATAVCQRIDPATALITVLDVDAASAEAQLRELRAAILPSALGAPDHQRSRGITESTPPERHAHDVTGGTR